MILSNLGYICKIYEKDSWPYANHSFTNSIQNTYRINVKASDFWRFLLFLSKSWAKTLELPKPWSCQTLLKWQKLMINRACTKIFACHCTYLHLISFDWAMSSGQVCPCNPLLHDLACGFELLSFSDLAIKVCNLARNAYRCSSNG